MSNTEKALAKLDVKQREWVETHKRMYKSYALEGRLELMREESYKSFGFLTGLEFAGVITNREKMLIHIYVTL